MADQGKLGYIISAYMAAVVLNMTSIFQWASIQAPLQNNKSAYRNSLAELQMLLAVLSSVVMTMVITALGIMSEWSPTYAEMGLIAAFIFFQQLADFDRRASYIFFNAARAAKSSFFIYPLRVGLLLYFRPQTISWVLLILVLTSLGPALLTILFSIKGGIKLEETIKFIKNEFGGSRWLVASGPLMWLWAYLPTYALGLMVNVTLVGAFITVRSLINFTNIAMELLETEISAQAGRLFATDSNKFQKSLRTLVLFGVSVWLAGLIAVWVFGPEILHAFYGERYSPYNSILTIMWVANLFIFLFRVNSIKFRTTGLTLIIPVSYGAGIVAVLASFYPLITALGIVGAAWIYSVSAGMILVWQYIMIGRTAQKAGREVF